MLVLDASVTVAWCFRDESTPETEAILDQVWSHSATVPAIWKLEVANALQSAVRRGRITNDYRDKSLRDFERMPISADSDTDVHAWGTTVRLSDEFRLTVYDAAYLELAIRTRLPLATLDADLRRAARRVGVVLAG